MDDLFQLLRKLPHHNFLNPGLLKYLAELSKCKYLVQSVKNYEKVFSSVKLNNLIESMGDKIQEIQVLKKNEIIMNCDEMIMKLEKEDMTVSELHGFTVKFQQNILYLRVGINLPRCVKKGCICIQWLIPSCLVDYVYHMACLNTKLFAEFNLLHVSVGKYKVELAEHSIGRNPIQILCDHYQFLLEAMDPSEICKMLFFKALLYDSDLNGLKLCIPNDYMRNSAILEYIRNLQTTSLFLFINALQDISSQKHISESLLKDLSAKGFTIISKIQDGDDKCPDSSPEKKLDVGLFEYNERELEKLKCSSAKKWPPIFPDKDIADKFKYIDPCNLMLKYLDLFDALVELLQARKVTDALREIMASDIHGISIFNAEFVEILTKGTNTISLLRILFPYTNWHDHSIIRELVEVCDCPEGVKLLDEFDSRIDVSLPITSYPIPAPSNLMIPDESSTHTVMAVRCEQQLSSLSLQHTEVVKSLMMNTFGITKHACILLAVANHSSAMFFWLIPKSVGLIITNEVREHSGFLHDNGLLEVAIFPNFSFSTGSISRVWKTVYFSDMATMYKHAVSKQHRYIAECKEKEKYITQLKDALSKEKQRETIENSQEQSSSGTESSSSTNEDKSQIQLLQLKITNLQNELDKSHVETDSLRKTFHQNEIDVNMLKEDLSEKELQIKMKEAELERMKALNKHHIVQKGIKNVMEVESVSTQSVENKGQLQQAKDQLCIEPKKARHLEDDKLMIKRHWTETEGVLARLRLQNEALQQQHDSTLSEYKKLECKYIQLNKENEILCRPARKPDNEHFQQPETFSTHTNQQHFVPNDHQCWLESVNKLLQMRDDLSKEMADNLSNTCIKGSRSNWKSLCEVLEVNYDNLHRVNPTERMLNIVKQYQQQNEKEVTVKIIYNALKSIRAKRAASLLLKRAMEVYEQHKKTVSESSMHLGRKPQPIHTSYSMSYASRTQMVTGEDDLCFSREHYDVTTVGVTNSSLGDEAISLDSTESPQDV
ncbi:uncharacterized protein [Dysidea avara]